MEERYDWFDEPVQLKFWMRDEEKIETLKSYCGDDCMNISNNTGYYCGGIGYRNEIICLHCGVAISLDDFYDQEFPEDKEPIVVCGKWDKWVDLSREMIATFEGREEEAAIEIARCEDNLYF